MKGGRMKALSLAIVAVLCAGCTPQAALLATALPENTSSVLLSHTQRVQDTNRRRIVAYEQSRDWAGLAQFAEENLKRDTHTPDWWLVAGYAYTQQQKHARAADCYLEAVRLEPDVALHWSLLAQAYRASGQPQRAVKALDNALLARRDDPQLYWLLGESESDMRRWREAASAYRAAIGVDAKHLPSWNGLQRAYAESGRAEEAREAQRMIDGLKAEQAKAGAAPRQ